MSIDQKNLQIDRQEILRYLGYGTTPLAAVEDSIVNFIDEAVEMVLEKCRMRFISKIFSLHVLDRAGASLSIGETMEIESKSLSQNLKGCQEAVLMAATLGVEADQLISRYSRKDMSQGLIMEATATAVIEEFCDQNQLCMEAELNRRQKTLRPRFSPGYGDFAIKHQRDMIKLLDTPRQMGLTLTDGCMLAPAKSVTAVMGIADFDSDGGGKNQDERRCTVKGCEACDKIDCQYRRNR